MTKEHYDAILSALQIGLSAQTEFSRLIELKFGEADKQTIQENDFLDVIKKGLACFQDVCKPESTLKNIKDTWPGGPNDGFEKAIEEHRHPERTNPLKPCKQCGSEVCIFSNDFITLFCSNIVECKNAISFKPGTSINECILKWNEAN